MPDLRLVIRATMRSLVESYGCYDAAAETINARWGGGASKGTICKKMAGRLDWTAPDIIALEDGMQRHPVTRLMARRLEARPVPEGSLLEDGSIIARESGEAISAILSAEQSSCADDHAAAINEIAEAIEALKDAQARLERRLAQGGRDG